MLKKLIVLILLLLLLFNIYTWATTDAAIIDPNSPVVIEPSTPPDAVIVTPETVTPTTPPAENIPKVDNSPIPQISPDINITVPNSEKKWTVNDIIFGSAFAATLISALLTTFVTLRSRKQDKRMKDTDVLRITLQIGSKKLIAPLTNLNDKLHSTEHLHNMQVGDTSNYYSGTIAQPLIELILDLRTFGGMLALEKAEQIETLSAQLKSSIIALDALLFEFNDQINEKEAMREKKISAILDVLFANECLAKYLNIPFI